MIKDLDSVAEDVLKGWKMYEKGLQLHWAASAKRLYPEDWELIIGDEGFSEEIWDGCQDKMIKVTDRIRNKYNVEIEHEDTTIRAYKIMKIGPSELAGDLWLTVETIDGKYIDARVC